MSGRLVLLVGDQLSHDIAALRHADQEQDTILMAEVAEEAEYVPHHRKKVAFLFSAMRHFAGELRERGWRVRYTKLDDPDNTGSLGGEVQRCIQQDRHRGVIVTEPGEYRLKKALEGWAAQWQVPLDMPEDDRFLASHQQFRDWAAGRRQLRMEHFYRDMRRRTGLLMVEDQPAGGQWNFDADNRKPPREGLAPPMPPAFKPDVITQEVLQLLERRLVGHFGELLPFSSGVTRDHALQALDHFVEHALSRFGDYQDAMMQGQRFLYHSVLSHYLNVGLLRPLEICQKVEQAWRDGSAPLNAVEGFIRQIIGWREYMRGIYWLQMPGYLQRNFFGAGRALPAFYWTGETDMACLRAVITQTREEAYAHHIQRLMVTGNFAMLAGVEPRQVHEWYLAVYADAYEWVEAPNVIGMSQFADGGLLSSKPYAAGGNYINRMSDHCRSCPYRVREKTGPRACPFNALYWDFLARNAELLRGNPRLAPVYRTWDRMKEDARVAYRDSARAFLDTL